jgi:hypothetical protein
LARHDEREWVVATALYRDCHRGGALKVGTLTDTVNNGPLERSETYLLTARAVGEVLRSLGLPTEKLGNQGRGLRLTTALVSRIHRLARDLGIKHSDILSSITVDAGYAAFECSLCQELGLMVCDDGRELRVGNPYNRQPGRGLYGSKVR